MLVLTQNEILIQIKDTAPAQRYKKIAKAVASAFRWRGNVPENNLCDNHIEGDNLVVLSDLMDAILSNTVIGNNDICIHLIESDPEEQRFYYIRALVAAIRWMVYERRHSDSGNLVELTRLIDLLAVSEVLPVQ